MGTTVHDAPISLDHDSAAERIVVAVDGSEGNRTAVAWAGAEAARTGRSLVLLSAISEVLAPIPYLPHQQLLNYSPGEARTMLRETAESVHRVHPDAAVMQSLHTGDPTHVILGAATDAEMIVLGTAGYHVVERVLIGSTSLNVAGHSEVPVVVVPDVFDPAAGAVKPVVVGVDALRWQPSLIRIAFERAQQLGVHVVAVFAWHAQPLLEWSPEMLARWSRYAGQALEEALVSASAEFPDVKVEARHPHARPGAALVEAGHQAQLVVLGRRTGPSHLGGLSLGSATRAVLHEASCPVMVVPMP